MTPIISSFAKGIYLGSLSTGYLTQVRDAKGYPQYTSILEKWGYIFEPYHNFILINESLTAIGGPPVPFKWRATIYISAPILSFFAREAVPPDLRRCSQFIRASKEILLTLAALVSTIALIAFGDLVLGMTAGTLIIMSILNRLELLPDWICKSPSIKKYTPLMVNLSALKAGSFIHKTISVLDILALRTSMPLENIKTEDREEAFNRPKLPALSEFDRSVVTGKIQLFLSSLKEPQASLLPTNKEAEIHPLNQIINLLKAVVEGKNFKLAFPGVPGDGPLTAENLKNRFRQTLLKCHPDKNCNFKELAQNITQLMNEIKAELDAEFSRL